MAINELSDSEKDALVKLYRVQKSSRKTYTHKEILRRIPNYKSVIKSLISKGYVYKYRGMKNIGLNSDGFFLAEEILREREELD